MKSRLFVTGGSGFIGSEVCRIAADQGHEVWSLSRSGRPEHLDEAWADQVNWLAGDVFLTDEWRHHLEGVDAVIHCVGIIREDPDEGVTFERVNGDAADIVSWEAEQAGIERFVFLSAAEKPPLVSERYLEAKRTGEAAIRTKDLKEAILRPNLVRGPERPATMVLGALLDAADTLPWLDIEAPLRVEQVAYAAVRAATEEGYEGTIGVDLIEYLANDDWKAYKNGETPVALPNPNTPSGDGAASASADGTVPTEPPLLQGFALPSEDPTLEPVASPTPVAPSPSAPSRDRRWVLGGVALGLGVAAGVGLLLWRSHQRQRTLPQRTARQLQAYSDRAYRELKGLSEESYDQLRHVSEQAFDQLKVIGERAYKDLLARIQR